MWCRIRQSLGNGNFLSHVVRTGTPHIVDDYEIELFLFEVCVGHSDFHLVSETVDVASAASAQTVVLFIEIIEIIGEIAHRHEAFAFVVVEFDI